MVCEDVTSPQICQVDVADKVTQVTDNPDFRSVAGPTWSHDGGKIVFSDVLDDPPGAALFIANADGSDVRQITDGESLDTQPVWSPDGEWIAFHRSCGLWRVRPDGSDAHELLGQSDGFCVQTPAWSPDGQRIAFLVFRSSSLEIWIINRDGSDPHGVYTIERPAGGGYLSWSPDGQQIGCWYNTGGTTAWGLLVSADGSGMAQGVDWEPFWWQPTFWPAWGIDYSESPEISIDLGTVNQARGLVQADFGDGLTAPVNVAGKDARVSVHNPSGGHFFYFRVHRTFLYAQAPPLQVKVEYLDQGDHRIDLSYDSADIES